MGLTVRYIPDVTSAMVELRGERASNRPDYATSAEGNNIPRDRDRDVAQRIVNHLTPGSG